MAKRFSVQLTRGDVVIMLGCMEHRIEQLPRLAEVYRARIAILNRTLRTIDKTYGKRKRAVTHV